MNKNPLVLSLLAAAVLGAAGVGLYRLGLEQGLSRGEAAVDGAAPMAATEDPSIWGIPQGEAATRRHIEAGLQAGDVDPRTGRKILYYHDPMVPGRKFDAPGKSPFMDMMLVPAYAGSENADDGTVTVSPRIRQNLGLRTGEVSEGQLRPTVSAVGNVSWNERGQFTLTARATGFVERLHVRATLDAVIEGQPLLELYVPDWVAVQEDYLGLRRMRGQDLAGLVDAARQRMRQAGMNDQQIALVERTGRVQPRITLVAPASGIVTELPAREGGTVMPGTLLARINELSTVWVEAEVPESQATMLRRGSPVSARTPALPGEEFTGTLQALLPEVNSATRTRKARLELANPTGQLVPGMFVQMTLAAPEARTALLVPTEALVRTGQRTLVMAVEGDDFRPLEVTTGIEQDGMTEILAGLDQGQRVVLSGQFLIDSEASLKGIEARLGIAEPVASAEAPLYRTRARLEAIDGEILTLTHPDIPELGWPAMTMDFRLAPEPGLPALSVGDQLDIGFRLREGEAPRIITLQPVDHHAPGGDQ